MQDITIIAPALPPEVDIRFRDGGIHLVETLSVMLPASNGFGVVIVPASLCPARGPVSLQVRTGTAEVRWAERAVILSHQLFLVFQRLLEKALTRDQWL